MATISERFTVDEFRFPLGDRSPRFTIDEFQFPLPPVFEPGVEGERWLAVDGGSTWKATSR
jgi:hypothetical protein